MRRVKGNALSLDRNPSPEFLASSKFDPRVKPEGRLSPSGRGDDEPWRFHQSPE